MNPENSGLLSVPPPPLPPPPLPPLPLQHLSCRLLTNLHPGNREEDNVIDLIKKAPLFFDFREEEIERYSFISLYNKAPSILQEGPTLVKCLVRIILTADFTQLRFDCC